MKSASIRDTKLNSSLSKPTMIDIWAKKIVMQWLNAFKCGRLILEDRGQLCYFGQSSQEAEITAHIIVEHDSVYRDVLLNGTVGSGEAFMKGTWRTPNLVNVIRLMCRNVERLHHINNRWSRLNSVVARCFHRLRANNQKNAKLNVAAHYDLGNEFFQLFLDPTMMYSSAIYPHPHASLSEASLNKLDKICQQLELNENDHLLEIGTGWGGMALYAAKHYGCQVTTTTISDQQYQYALSMVKRQGLDNKIKVLLEDYRNLQGTYSKLVSIEMIEAVGRKYIPNYFAKCCRLLTKGGTMLLQSITIPEQRYDLSAENVDFIQRYIFPGGELPTLSAICQHVGRETNMQVIGLEDITADYARTLSDWRKAFFNNLDHVLAMGYDDIFVRMWEFYLSYCEGGFRERTIGCHQALMTKL